MNFSNYFECNYGESIRAHLNKQVATKAFAEYVVAYLDDLDARLKRLELAVAVKDAENDPTNR